MKLLSELAAKALLRVKTILSGALMPTEKGPGSPDVIVQTKTIVDMLDDPIVGGGIRPVIDILSSYLESDHKNLNNLCMFFLRLFRV